MGEQHFGCPAAVRQAEAMEVETRRFYGRAAGQAQDVALRRLLGDLAAEEVHNEAVLDSLLRPAGRLFIREGHPVLWSLDDEREDDLLVVRYPYFEQAQPLVFDAGGTYVETDAVFTHNVTHSWNHGLGEIVTALFDAGMDLTMLVEHDSVPWNALPGQMEQVETFLNGAF